MKPILYRHKTFRVLILAASLLLPRAFGQSHPSGSSVLLISIDGLRPDYVTQADKHGLKIPNLRRLMQEGAHATSVHGVLPTVTYSSHTTIVTGVSPAKHGIYSNKPFDPTARNTNGWYWYAEDVQVPTLWDAVARTGHTAGNVSWPVTVGSPGIRFNIPEYAGTRTAEDLKMIRALSTPDLITELEKKAGPYRTDVNEDIPRDWARTRYAIEMIRAKHPYFLTVHLAASDHEQHEHGPFSPNALKAIEEIDKMVGMLGAAMHASDPQAAICVVSDHGFAPVDHLLKLDAVFVKAGLITLKSKKESLQLSGIVDWVAIPWSSGGSAAIVLKDPKDSQAKAKVKQVLDNLASDPNYGVAGILNWEMISQLGGAPMAAFWLDMRPGFALSSSLSDPVVVPVSTRGAHGHSPTHPELSSFFLIAGRGIRQGINLGEIDMRNIAPTLAMVLSVPFPKAELAPLGIQETAREIR